ncbi:MULTISPECIES: hypothetical protein [Corynebacterium]|uniref:Uncharacterized protein n=2 Tax=Corynebacterium glucuronolyticum TaxID=39791 RepID=A0A7T4JVB4_9CORY|nr:MULTISPECIES: hypothetical protein [Corynebacterium]EEI27906.1 hypothetical protein HMPREF0294_0520 [Corynebacterium glucuronolyticum ATCC 51867]EEI64054.1 hypothetical protein HMPREF0293_0441 [Corynebacterium glucuronolyticum ATCC 51866]MCT1442215.1 hypothetical protein [Corynebacterium glucuronolyticum]MCT1564197.1 hypothetical protein [Corynebacterium glucuronolyticum]OFO48949.1 hypothetical protein HMPREF3044_07965 [Corynebacterium sp. HMSC073D01]
MTWLSRLLKRGSDEPTTKEHIAASRTNVPLDDHMTLLFAQELPFHPAEERAIIEKILKEYEGPTITSQDMLPQQIRDLMDL